MDALNKESEEALNSMLSGRGVHEDDNDKDTSHSKNPSRFS